MSIYDKDGNIIGGGGNVKDAFLELVASGEINLGSPIGASLVYNNLTDAWITNATSAYNSMYSAYRESPNVSVPFFVSTDQHGHGLEQHRWINNRDVDGVNMANVNLGDTVVDYYTESALNSAYARTKQVKNYMGVVGNHDKHYSSSGDVPSDFIINKTFLCNYSHTKSKVTNDCYVAYDGYHAVKYLCIDNYILASNGQSFVRGWSAAIADWIIAELSKNDGYDVVVCIHFPMHPKHRLRSESEETATQSSAENFNNPHQMACWNLMIARKNKTSGTFEDLDGTQHAYDFTGCQTNLLCILSGHAHEERISTSYGLTNYTTDGYLNEGSCTFGLIDRANSNLKIWKFNTSGVSDLLTLPI